MKSLQNISEYPNIVSRREFLASLLSASATAVLIPGSIPFFKGDDATYGANGLRSTFVLADLHSHPRLNAWIESSGFANQTPGLAKLISSFMNKTGVDWKECHRNGVNMLCVAHFNPFDEFASMPSDPNPDAPRQTLRLLDDLERELNGPLRPFARLVTNAEELSECVEIPHNAAEFRIAVVHCIEGAHALGYDLSAVEPLAKRGVAMVGVTHFFTKGLASSGNSIPNFPDAGALHTKVGLMPRGEEIIRELQKNGIIIDIAHATPATVSDILRVTSGPVVASHISCYALGDHPYSLRDEHIKEIADRGGLIGVILMPHWLSNYNTVELAADSGGLDDVVRSVRYIYKFCGNHRSIALGSDFGGYITGPRDMTRLSQIGRLREKLLAEFADESNCEEIVDGIVAKNTIEFFNKNWGKCY